MSFIYSISNRPLCGDAVPLLECVVARFLEWVFHIDIFMNTY